MTAVYIPPPPQALLDAIYTGIYSENVEDVFDNAEKLFRPSNQEMVGVKVRQRQNQSQWSEQMKCPA